MAVVAEVKNRTGGLRQAELKAIRALAGEMLRLGEAEIDAMRAGRSGR